jgi:HSP20 family protein
MEVDQLGRMFDELWGSAAEPGRWVPAVDIYETGSHEVVLKAELPGMTREDIHLTVERNVLTISGERRYAPEIRRDQFHRLERLNGPFSRSFTLPPTLDTTKIAASYEDGVLTVTLPQREEAKPRQISVAVK